MTPFSSDILFPIEELEVLLPYFPEKLVCNKNLLLINIILKHEQILIKMKITQNAVDLTAYGRI